MKNFDLGLTLMGWRVVRISEPNIKGENKYFFLSISTLSETTNAKILFHLKSKNSQNNALK